MPEGGSAQNSRLLRLRHWRAMLLRTAVLVSNSVAQLLSVVGMAGVPEARCVRGGCSLFEVQDGLAGVAQLHQDMDSHRLNPHMPLTPRQIHVQGYVALCLVVKDQARDMPEWLEWHARIGVGRMYVFDMGSSPPLNQVTALNVQYCCNGIPCDIDLLRL